MANSVQGLSSDLLIIADTFAPQQITGTGNGTAVKFTSGGTNRINGRLSTGAAVAFTSMAIKFQASPDGSTNWNDCVDVAGNVVTFPASQVIAGNTNYGIVSFQPPMAYAGQTTQYQYLRAVVTAFTGTSIYLTVNVLYWAKFGAGGSGYLNTSPSLV